MLWDTTGNKAKVVCSLTKLGDPREERYNRHVSRYSVRDTKSGRISDSLQRHLTSSGTLKYQKL